MSIVAIFMSFNILFFLTQHRLCCRKRAIASSMLSFYVIIVVISTLYTLFGLPLTSWIVWFIAADIFSIFLTVLEGLWKNE